MDKSKRQLLGQIAAISAGAAFLPVAQASTSKPQAASGKRYGMLIDLRRCVGCQACTVACTIENQPPLGQFRTTVNQYEVTQGQESAFMMLPRLCNHCENPPCIPVCPTGATFQRQDGIVVVDSHWCVGCGYCVQACPYDARFINHDTNTADKCTFCAHRLEAACCRPASKPVSVKPGSSAISTIPAAKSVACWPSTETRSRYSSPRLKPRPAYSIWG